MAELPGHPFFLATLFQPELWGDGRRPHPVVPAFAITWLSVALAMVTKNVATASNLPMPLMLLP
ncbi:hypothetical protein ABZ297_37765, partial [Nonomuraea sp. NPDC005983]